MYFQSNEAIFVYDRKTLKTIYPTYALLPVTVSGLGARELIYIKVLQSHAVPRESAVALSLLHLFVMSISATLFGFCGVVWRQRQRI